MSRRRDCGIALTAGFVVLLISTFAADSLFRFGRISLSALLFSNVAAIFSTLATFGFVPLHTLPRESGLPLAGRAGSAMGLRTGFVAGGMMVLGAHLSGLQSAFLIWLPGILCIMPAALAGIIVAASVALSGRMSERVERPVKDSQDPAAWEFLNAGVALFGFLSPLLLPSAPFRSSHSPHSAAVPPSVGSDAGDMKVPVRTPPPFSFSPSQLLATAQPECWRMADVKVMPEVDGSEQAPVALSPDGRTLLCCQSGSDRRSLQLLDLLTLQVTRAWRLEYPAGHLCFSPDSRSIFIESIGHPSRLSVIAEDHTLSELPRVEPGPPSDSVVEWQSERTLTFWDGGIATSLSLDSLLLERRVSKQRRNSFNQGSTWRFAARLRCQSAALPAAAGREQNWQVERVRRLAVEHPVLGTVRVFDSPDIAAGDRLLCSPDGTTLIRLNGGGAFLYYFEERPPPPLYYEITMPREPDRLPEGSPIRDPGRQREVRVMAYPPLLNPLTGRCVGPDRNRILGRARITSWERARLRLQLVEVAEPLPADAVFADPHTESSAGFELLDLGLPHRWWAEAGKPAEGPSSATLSASLPDFAESVTLSPFRGAFTVVMGAPPSSSAKTPSEAPPPAATQNPIDRLREFVLAHHRKASAGDWSGVADDYDDWVDYFDRGRISRDAIRQDQRSYHERFDTEETVGNPSTHRDLGGGWHETSYTLTSVLRAPGKPTETKQTKVSLVVREVPGGFLITSQNPKR